MASGKTLELRYMRFKPVAERETRPRDRSLRGKARIKARKIANKEK